MSFAAPAMLAAALLALPLIALYLIKVRRRAVTVGYLRLWSELLSETRARSLFERLKRWLSLLVQLALLALLVLALADPTREARGSEARQTVVLIDASASMLAREAGGKTRFALALEEVERELQARRGDDALMLVLATDRLEVLCPFERSGLRLREALRRAHPTQRRLDADRALAFAGQVLRDQPHPRVLVLGDGSAGELARARAAWQAHSAREGRAAPPLELRCVGEARDNVGVVRFAARKNTSLGTDYVLAVVQNFGPAPKALRLELSLDGATRSVLPRTIAPGAALTERFQLALPQGGTLRLRLAPVTSATDAATTPGASGADGAPLDALGCDDVAYAVVRPTRLRKVLLVCPAEAQLEPFRLAFQAMQEVVDPASQALTVAEYQALPPAERAADVTLCVGALPEGLPPRGNLFLVATPLPPGLPATLGPAEAQPAVWDWERDHVLNRYLNWRDLPLPAARPLALTGGDDLVRSYEGSLLAAFEQEGRRVVYVAFDLGARLFPFRLAFPVLLRNALAWFELQEDLLLRPSYAPGELIAPLRPVPGPEVFVRWFPPGATQPRRDPLPVREGRFFFTGTEEPGPVAVELGSGVVHATCVNLFAPGEQAIAPTPAREAETPPAPPTPRGLFGSELWPLLALLALGLWALEWGTYHRRWTE
ncbi:MAG: VWA domain-containing protein [Planctomycetota bacterium]